MTNLDSRLKKQRHHFADKGPYSQSYDFSSSHVWMWELDHKEGKMLNWCFWIVDWRRLLRVPRTARRSNQSILKEINPEYPLEGLTLKLKLQYFWPPDAKSWLIRKDPDAGKDWRQEEKGTTEDEMVGQHHWLNGYEFEPVLVDGKGQRILACCSPWGCRVGHSWATEQQQKYVCVYSFLVLYFWKAKSWRIHPQWRLHNSFTSGV